MTHPSARTLQKVLFTFVVFFVGCASMTPAAAPPSTTQTQDQATLDAIFKNRVCITQDIIDVKSLAGSILYQVQFQGQLRYAFEPLTTDENQIKVATQTNTPFQCTYDNTVNFTASLSYFVSLSGSLTKDDKASVTFADVFSATGPSITPTIATAIQAWIKSHPNETKTAYYIRSARLSTLTTSVYHSTAISGNFSAPIVNFGGKQNYVQSRVTVVPSVSVDLDALPGGTSTGLTRAHPLRGSLLRTIKK
jgi:hypothetical protein